MDSHGDSRHECNLDNALWRWQTAQLEIEQSVRSVLRHHWIRSLVVRLTSDSQLQVSREKTLGEERRLESGMNRQFDAIEGGLVQSRLSLRSAVFLLVPIAMAAFGVLVIFSWLGIGMYSPSFEPTVRGMRILYLEALALIWLSVLFVRRIDRDLLLFAIPFAILLTLLWVYGFLFGGPRPGV